VEHLFPALAWPEALPPSFLGAVAGSAWIALERQLVPARFPLAIPFRRRGLQGPGACANSGNCSNCLAASLKCAQFDPAVRHERVFSTGGYIAARHPGGSAVWVCLLFCMINNAIRGGHPAAGAAVQRRVAVGPSGCNERLPRCPPRC